MATSQGQGFTLHAADQTPARKQWQGIGQAPTCGNSSDGKENESCNPHGENS
ncbi:MAG: hypothetical protein KME35_23260 [Aphanocapsa sp. GSE-SYN-MK-11-07L]|nr:hypothetical protein [Aphanocapsa sp. GSE-SYN-MK-11-07L]